MASAPSAWREMKNVEITKETKITSPTAEIDLFSAVSIVHERLKPAMQMWAQSL